MKHIFIDVHPSYQPKVNWKLLKEKGVTGIIAKSGAGLQNYSYFHDYVKAAKDNGFFVGAYHWLDPIYNASAQAITMAKTEALPEVDFTANDFEQWWSNWALWYDAVNKKIPWSSVPRFDPYKLGTYLGLFNDEAKKILVKPHVTYTSNWFIQGYTKNVSASINDFKLWTASYPYPKGYVTLTWEEFLSKHLPAETAKPIVPQGSTLDNILIWQFTGDRFILPGVFGDVAGNRPSALDVNFFLGDLDDFLGKKTVEPKVDCDCPIGDRLSDIENKVSLIKNSLSDVREMLKRTESDLDKLVQK